MKKDMQIRERWHTNAKAYIEKVESELKTMGVLKDLDINNLNLLGDSLTIYYKCIETLDRDGLTVTDSHNRVVAHPCCGLLRNQQSCILALIKELSISLRQRRMLVKDNMVNESTPIEELFSGAIPI